MRKQITYFLIILLHLFATKSAMAYLLPVSGYEDTGNLYINTNTIIRTPPTVKLSYVESFSQPKSYGSVSYTSKATDVVLDCVANRITPLAVAYYSGPNLHGTMLGKYPLNDQPGASPVGDSWSANLLKLGCMPRRY